MKEVIRKGKLVNNSLPKHLILNNRNIFDQKTIANSFNEYFVNVGPKLASEMSQLQRSFELYLTRSDSSFEEATLPDEEIKTAFFSLKCGESRGFDEINYDIVKQNFNSLLVPLKCIFDLSLLPYFSKMLERIMYNRIYKYLTKNDLLYCKQFGFHKGYSTEHAIIQVVQQINKER